MLASILVIFIWTCTNFSSTRAWGSIMTTQGERAKGKIAEAGGTATSVKIIYRHHFASKLQRMSVLASVSGEVWVGFALRSN